MSRKALITGITGQDGSYLVEKIRDMVDPSIPIVSYDGRKRAGKVEIPMMIADVSKLNGRGWSPKVGFEEGLGRTVMVEKVNVLSK